MINQNLKDKKIINPSKIAKSPKIWSPYGQTFVHMDSEFSL
jgi:hypothetical protein